MPRRSAIRLTKRSVDASAERIADSLAEDMDIIV